MKLYIQFEKGKQIKDPQPIEDCSLSYSRREGVLYASSGGYAVARLDDAVLNRMSVDGMVFTGIKKTFEHGVEICYGQRWWATWE